MEIELIQLPPEILLLITNYLTFAEANNLSKTCSYLFKVTNDQWSSRAKETLENLTSFDANRINEILDEVILQDQATTFQPRFRSHPSKKIIVDPSQFVIIDRKWIPKRKITDDEALSFWQGPAKPFISVVGKTGSGKNGAVYRLIYNYFYPEEETIQDIFGKNLAFGSSEKLFCLKIENTGGNPEYDSVVETSITEANCLMIVFSIIDRDSFTCVYTLIDRIVQARQVDDIRKVPIVLISAKNDLEEQRQVTRREMLQLAVKLDVPLFEIRSAIDNDNVEDAFRQAVLEIMHKAHQYSSHQ